MFDPPKVEFRYIKALNFIEEMMSTCKCPLSEDQKILLSGALAVLMPQDEGANACPGLPSWELRKMGIEPSRETRAQGYMDGEWPFPRSRKKNKS